MIEELIAKYGLPPGYLRLPWAQAKIGLQVWIYGTGHDDNDAVIGRAYGPFVVADVKNRHLLNARTRSLYKARSFHEMEESLLLCPGLVLIT